MSRYISTITMTICLMFCSTAFSRTHLQKWSVEKLRSIAEFRDRIKSDETSLLFQNRSSQLRVHAGPRECTVVVLHGLFQSPRDMQGIINHYYANGCHVIAPLLAGHWRTDPDAYYKVTATDWVEQTAATFRFASELGGQVFAIGHSTGALLALNYQLNSPPTAIHKAILIAPPLQISVKATLAALFGSLFRISQKSELNDSSDYSKQIRPAIAGRHVLDLHRATFGQSDEEREIAYNAITVPTLLISTENDATIQHAEVVRLARLRTKLMKIMVFKKEQGVFHDSIQRSDLDIENLDPREWRNSYFSKMIAEMDSFLFSD